jgi:hypothetical protein
MAREISSFAEGSPIESAVGNRDDDLSFLSVCYNASNHAARLNLKYRNEVIEYCIEWEAVVTSRIDKEVENTKKLREMYNHYLDKVDALRKKVNVQETKGKGVNDTLAEKLQRNEEKLDEASNLFEAAARPLCVLIEEVVLCAWKDLYPMIQATMKFEMERSQQESRTFHLFQCDALESTFCSETGKPHGPALTPGNKSPLSINVKKAAKPNSGKGASSSNMAKRKKPAAVSEVASKNVSSKGNNNDDASNSSSTEPDERSSERKVDAV